MSTATNPFITEVKGNVGKWKYIQEPDRFRRVRVEHGELMEVVAKFGQKVGLSDKANSFAL